MVDVCKTEKQRDRDSKFLDVGIGVKDIPNSAKRQRVGFNSQGIRGKVTRNRDPFLKQNFGSMNIKGGVSIHDIVGNKRKKTNFMRF